MSDIAGHGTTFKFGPSTASVTLVDVVSIANLSASVGTRDTTVLGAAIKTSAPTLLEPGELPMTIRFDPAVTSHASVFALLSSKALQVCELGLASGSTCAFSAFITSFSLEGMATEEGITASVTWKVNTTMTWTTPGGGE